MAEWKRENYWITNDPAKFDYDVLYNFLAKEAYWSRNIPREVMRRSIENSLGFGLFCEERQVGFARVISDYATIAYLGDVFVLSDFRGRGLGTWLMACVMEHPELQGLRRWILLTSDAHELYKKYAFKSLLKPELYMERHNPHVYTPAVSV